MNDLKRIEAKVDINELELWRHHCQNAGIKTNQAAINEAIMLHTEYLLSGRKSTFLIEQALDEGNKDERQEQIAAMAQLLKLPGGNFVIEPCGRHRFINLRALNTELRGAVGFVVLILILTIIAVIWLN